MELLTLVMYDIEDDRIRLRIAEDCKDAGLERVQYSVFRGRLSRTHRGDLAAKLVDRLGSSRGRILIVSICEKDIRDMREFVNDMLDGWPAGHGGMAA
jgi:CRISPR-associated protein Cas2